MTIAVNDDDMSLADEDRKEFFINKNEFIGMDTFKKFIEGRSAPYQYQYGLQIITTNHKFEIIFDIKTDRTNVYEKIRSAFTSEDYHSVIRYLVD